MTESERNQNEVIAIIHSAGSFGDSTFLANDYVKLKMDQKNKEPVS